MPEWEIRQPSMTREEAAKLMDDSIEKIKEISRWYKEQYEGDKLYTDYLTGIQMAVERDHYPDHPKITIICPEGHYLTAEEINGALGRLRRYTGLSPDELPSPYTF